MNFSKTSNLSSSKNIPISTSYVSQISNSVSSINSNKIHNNSLSKNDNIFSNLILWTGWFLVILAFLFLIYFIYNKYLYPYFYHLPNNNYEIQRMNTQIRKPFEKYSKDYKCPNGCYQGFCDPNLCYSEKLKKHCCKKDIECQICKNKDGFGYINDYLVKVKEEPELTPQQFAEKTLELNKEIRSMNRQIMFENDEINRINKDISKRKKNQDC